MRGGVNDGFTLNLVATFLLHTMGLLDTLLT